MSDTPRMNLALRKAQEDCTESYLLTEGLKLERELNAANERIKRLEAVTNDPHALWANWLRGSVTLPVGIGDVREYQDRIQRLEEDLMDAKNKHAALIADVVLYEDRGERIKRLEEAGDVLCENSNPSRWDSTEAAAQKLTEQSNWLKAKEAKP